MRYVRASVCRQEILSIEGLAVTAAVVAEILARVIVASVVIPHRRSQV
jgi:hypothetical protein